MDKVLAIRLDSSASVSTRITRRFGQVDVILLVDNAQQPMQAAPLSVLRAVAHRAVIKTSSLWRLLVLIKLRGRASLRFRRSGAHVMASVLNALSTLRDVLGGSVVKAIEHGVDSRCFMLGGVDRQLTKLPSRAADYMKGQLTELVRFFETSILLPCGGSSSHLRSYWYWLRGSGDRYEVSGPVAR